MRIGHKFNRNNKNNNPNMRIKIKRRYRYFKMRNIVMILCLVTISLMSGAIGAEFIVDRYLKDINISNNVIDHKSYEENNKYSNILSKISKSLVTVSNSPENLQKSQYDDSNFTGVVVDGKGYILTNYSTIQSFEKIYIKIPSQGAPAMEAEIVGKDIGADIAVLKINYSNLEPIEIEQDDGIKMGDSIIVAGNVYGRDYATICTSGIITTVEKQKLKEVEYTFLQTNAIINELNTGGPICNMDGKLVGFASKSLTDKYNKQNLFYGVSAINVKNVKNNIIGLKSTLGIMGKEIEIDSSITGLYVESVIQDGYAAKAGIKSSDIIISIDDKKVKNTSDLYEAVKDKKVGDSVVCVILRNRQQIEINIDF